MSELIIKVKAATEEAVKAFKQMSGQIGDLYKKAEEFSKSGKIAFEAFKGALASQAVVGAFNLFKEGIAGSVDYLKESVKASADAEVALNQLNTSLALAGRYSRDTSDDFVKFAESLQSTTVFEDDAIIKNAALLESMGKLTKDGLKQATKAALDLAAGTGKTMDEAFGLLAKASVGGTTQLSKVGISFKTTGDNAKDFQSALVAINKQFGGAAESQVNTFSGALQQQENIYGNLRESLGDLVTKNPLVIAGIKDMSEIFNSLKTIIDDNQQLFKELVGNAFSSLISLIPTLARGVATIIDVFTALSNVSNFVADKVLGIAQAFYEYKKSLLEVRGSIQDFFGTQDEYTKNLIKNTDDTITELKGMRDAVDEEAANRIAKSESITTAINNFADQATKALQKQAEKAKQSSNTETENFLTNLSKKNEGIKALNKNEQALEDARKKRLEENRKQAFAAIQQAKELREEQDKQIKGILGAGLFGALNPEIKDKNRLNTGQIADAERNQKIAVGTGIAASVLGGKGGAMDLVVGGGKAVADMILPGLGQAVGPILSALAQGPDAVKGFINDFVESVPVLVTNIAESMPAVVDSLIDQLPRFIDSMIAAVPRVFNALVLSLPRLIDKLVESAPLFIDALVKSAPLMVFSLQAEMPKIAVSFLEGLVRNIPYLVSNIASALYNAITDMFNKLNPFSSDGGSFLDSINPFAEGGYVKKVPSGYPNDSFPARLTEGELVIDRSNAAKLESFLNGQSDNVAILNKILSVLSSPINVESSVQVNQQTFAQIILELTRQNRRLA